MKKFVVLLVMAALLVFSVAAFAVEMPEFSTDNLEFVGGVTYNTFDLTSKIDGVDQKNWEDKEAKDIKDDLDSGCGFYAGGLYWLNEQVGVGAGFDYATSSYKKEGVKDELKLTAPYGNVVYRVNDNIKVNAGLAYYSLKADETKDGTKTTFKADKLGFLLGGQYAYPVEENLSIIGEVNYRFANLDVKDVKNTKIDMSGLRASFGVSYNF